VWVRRSPDASIGPALTRLTIQVDLAPVIAAFRRDLRAQRRSPLTIRNSDTGHRRPMCGPLLPPDVNDA
jgi:hypothetical protein